MDFDKLKYFMRVAECEHITKAANDCYMTQPSLSRIITQLETEVGAKLFDREGRSLKLNDSGRVVYASAARILEEWRDMQEQLDDLGDGRAGRISFATTFPSFEDDWIGGCVRAYLTEHPGAQFSQVMLSSYAARDALLAREVDAVVSDQPITDSAIQWQEIFTERLGVALSERHPLASKSVLSVKELENCEFYSNNDNGKGKDLVTAICEQAGFRPKIVFQGNYPEYVDTAVNEGCGITFITEGAYLAGIARRGRSVSFRPVLEDYCRRTYGLAWLRSRVFPRVAQDFMDTLLRCDVAQHRKDLMDALLARRRKNGTA